MNDPGADGPLAALPLEVGVIRSKIVPKRLATGAVSRQRLVERLQRGKRRSLTLLSAPGGYGKTTLLTAWLSSPSPPACAWVSLDRRDTDPARLWSHLIVALNGVESRVGTASLAALRARPEQIVEHVLPVLLDELSGEGPDLVVVLDDYHLAECPDVDATIEAFMRYRPERVQLVVSTRSDPVLGIARLRASGELLEVRAEHLRFNDREVAACLAGLGVAEVTDQDTVRLTERTGGWPAPLRLLALLIQDQEPSAFVDSFAATQRPVVEYLITDVLELLDPDAQDFVLKVSILTRMCGSLCDAVVGRPGSGRQLAELERANLFSSVDPPGGWYSQHQLFAEAMHLELVRTRHDLLPTLHRRAAGWFEETGDLESATDHAIESRDVAFASRLVAAQVESLAARGRWATVRGWLARLSWPAALEDPELAWIRATSDTFGHDLDGAERWLDVAGGGAPDAMGALEAPLGYRVEMLRALVGVNDVKRAEEAAHRALELAPGPVWRGAALAGLGQAQYLRGANAEARDTLRRAVALIPYGHPNLQAFVIGNFGLAEYAADDASHASAMLDRASTFMAIQPQTVTGAVLHLALGERARHAGDPRGAVGWYESAIEILGAATRSGWIANAYLLNARANQMLGEATRAVQCLDAADAILDTLPDPGNLARRSVALRRRSGSATRATTVFGEEVSEREIAVLQLAGQGLTQREIADQLFISFNTVKTHLQASYRKLGATSRDDALARLADLRATAEPPRTPDAPIGPPS